MLFNDHSELAGRHALLSPSSPHWLNYDRQKLHARYHSVRASVRGTDLHNLAHESIRLGVVLDPRNEALAEYVLDALEYRMTCEVALYWSPNCFGHADTLSFWGNVLRIHDLKNGLIKANFVQLEVYAALFCLEYDHSPFEIDEIELRIYQCEEVKWHRPTPERIQSIMEKIVESDSFIETLREEDQWS